MALCHLYPFSFPPSSHLGAIPSLPKPQGARRTPSRGDLICVCFAKKSGKREKASKAVKSNKELRDELREWMSGLGLPEDHVPSMKELCEHGRKDLANIVRQRGYKVIAELLRNPTEKNNYTELCSAKDEDLFDSEKHKTSEEKERTIDDSAESSFFSSMSASIEAFPDSLNGSTPLESSAIEVSIPSIKYLHAKANRFVLTGELDTLEEAAERPSSRNNNLLSQGLNASDSDASLASEMTLERQTRAEIDCLKNQLYQKEIELSKLKVQIEKEKLALSNLEAKANGEISNAQRIISAKDMELRLAEESLCGLKEVRIEYWATGETVEVAGSFNGWQHCIKMDLHPSSKSVKSTASRKSLLRSTILWLYPGIYEIKFIVDGEWRVDLQREMISCGNITNNVLRVDR